MLVAIAGNRLIGGVTWQCKGRYHAGRKCGQAPCKQIQYSQNWQHAPVLPELAVDVVEQISGRADVVERLHPQP